MITDIVVIIASHLKFETIFIFFSKDKTQDGLENMFLFIDILIKLFYFYLKVILTFR